MAVDIDVAEFEDIESLDKAFKKAIAKADEEDEAGIRSQWSDAKVSFYQLRESRAQLEVARRDALDKYPLAKELMEDVRGTSPAEIEASAKRIHERFEKFQKEQATAKQTAADADASARQQAQQGYGAPVGAGGGTPSAPAVDPTSKEAAIARVHAKLARGEGMQRGGDKMDVITMGNERLRQAIDFQREPHPDLGLGVGGSYRGEGKGNPIGTPVVNALTDVRKNAKRT